MFVQYKVIRWEAGWRGEARRAWEEAIQNVYLDN